MIKYKILKNGNLFIFIAVLIMLVLFISSAQTYEQQSSVPLLKTLLKNKPLYHSLSRVSLMYAGNEINIGSHGYFKLIEFFIRKGAHFFTYLLLGGSLFLGLLPRIKHIGLTFFIAWLSATGYAGLDEFHQMLTGGRTPLIQDVFLDSMGALSGCVVCIFYIVIKKRLVRINKQ